MKLLLIGATGMIGSRILKEAQRRGHQITATARRPEGIEALANVQAVSLDVADTQRLLEFTADVDTVISAVSPRNTEDTHGEALAYADALIDGLGTTRLVLVGGAGSLNLPDGTPVAEVAPEEYRAEAQAMRAAFEKIAQSDLDYTVLAPAGEIAPGERTGTFRLGGRTYLVDDEGNSRISAEDYAIALMDEVEAPQHSRQIFTAAY